MAKRQQVMRQEGANIMAEPEPFELPVYLDNNSTTAMDPKVVEAMLPYFTSHYGNAASSTHDLGRRAKRAVTEATEVIAAAIHAEPDEIVFTSGATESCNLAIRGICTHRAAKASRILSSPLEHRSVLDPILRLSKEGFQSGYLKPANLSGSLDLEELNLVSSSPCDLACLMLANNEIGSLLDIQAVSAILKQNGVLFYCDAAQALGKVEIDVQASTVDLMGFSAHKANGPMGIGALYVRRGTRLKSMIEGGGHQAGRRSGTLNVPGIIGFAKAAELAKGLMDSEIPKIVKQTRRFFEGLRQMIPGLHLNGPEIEERLPGNLNIRIEGVDAETLTLKTPSICVSTGSACSSAQPEPSHVLRAIGLSESASRECFRIGLGRFTTDCQIDFAVKAIGESVRSLRNKEEG